MRLPVREVTYSQLEAIPEQHSGISTFIEITCVLPQSLFLRKPAVALVPSDASEELASLIMLAPTSKVEDRDEDTYTVSFTIISSYLRNVYRELKSLPDEVLVIVPDQV